MQLQNIAQTLVTATLLVTSLTLPSPADGRTQAPFRIAVIDFREEPLSRKFREKFVASVNTEFLSIGLATTITYESVAMAQNDPADTIKRALAFRPDAIYATTTGIAKQVRLAAPNLPIVFSGTVDPTAVGLVERLDRPGGNISGFVSYSETSEMRWKLLTEAFPKIRTIGLLADHDRLPSTEFEEMTRRAAHYGIKLRHISLSPTASIRTVENAIQTANVDAFDVFSSILLRRQWKTIIQTINFLQKPAIFHHEDFVERGGLMSYSHIEPDFHVVASRYLRRIATGVPVGDIPVSFPTEFLLAINLTTAKSVRHAIAPSFLKRANTFFH